MEKDPTEALKDVIDALPDGYDLDTLNSALSDAGLFVDYAQESEDLAEVSEGE